MDVKITDNSDEVKRQLERAIENALYTIGAEVETNAKKIVPVDTGRLRNSITHQEDMQDQSTTIGTNVEYAIPVEFGTYKMRERPYLRPAVEQEIPRVQKIVKAALKGGNI